MNIIFVSSSQYPEGGAPANRHLALTKGLAEAGHTVTFILLARQKGDNSELRRIGAGLFYASSSDALHCKNHRLQKIRSIKTGMQIILRLLNHIKIDTIILLDTFGWDLIPFIRLARRKGIKVLHERTEYPYLKTFRTIKDRINFFVYSSYVLRRINGIFVINEALKAYFNDLLDNKVPVKIINMIVDTDRFSSVPVNDSNEFEYIAYCGSLNSEKDGVDILVEAFCMSVQSGNIPSDIKLMLIGEYSNEDFRNRLEMIIQENNCGGNIIFTGKVERSRMPELLTGASALALSRPYSIQSEGGFPTKLGEYLATGNPVVVTSVGEIGRFLKDRYNAFVAKPGDIKSFSEKLGEIFTDYRKAVEIGKKGKMLTENEFNYLAQARELTSFIGSL